MSRNNSGAYTLPIGNPVAAGTLIEAEWANLTLSDIATAMMNHERLLMAMLAAIVASYLTIALVAMIACM